MVSYIPLREQLSKVACSAAYDLCDLAKNAALTMYDFTYGLVSSAYQGATTVMNRISEFYDSVPWYTKAAITVGGSALEIASGLGAAAGIKSVATVALSNAAINAGISVATQMITKRSVDVNEVMQSAGRGFLDGAFTAGVIYGVCGATTIAGKITGEISSNPAVREFAATRVDNFKKFMADETGSLDWSDFGKTSYGKSSGKDKIIPSVKNGEFNKFFDSLTCEELDLLWENPNMRRTIEARLRSPGGLHEWHLVSRTPIFKRWGISAEQIKEMRTITSDVRFVNPKGVHGGRGSTIAHNELLGIIDSSIDYDMFVRRLNNWANYRLEGGIKSLPKGLQYKGDL
ncbi:MAG: hypothetical protein K6G88_11330 [Lachnospiraceae bacterium]|nr:hypothetical protein [Lachnospiraceae bacterium]